MATQAEVKAIITELCDAYPDWKPSDMKGTLTQYERAFGSYPVDVLKHAAYRCIDTCIRMPVIAEIKKAIAEIRATTIPDTADVPYFPKKVTSPKVRALLDEFRQKMVNSGKWTEGYRKSRYNDRRRV